MACKASFVFRCLAVIAIGLGVPAGCSSPTTAVTGPAKLTIVNSSSETLESVFWHGVSFGTISVDTVSSRMVTGTTAGGVLTFYRGSQQCSIDLDIPPDDTVVFTIRDTTSCYYYK
jgi:hypothetical protein